MANKQELLEQLQTEIQKAEEILNRYPQFRTKYAAQVAQMEVLKARTQALKNTTEMPVGKGLEGKPLDEDIPKNKYISAVSAWCVRVKTSLGSISDEDSQISIKKAAAAEKMNKHFLSAADLIPGLKTLATELTTAISAIEGESVTLGAVCAAIIPVFDKFGKEAYKYYDKADKKTQESDFKELLEKSASGEVLLDLLKKAKDPKPAQEAEEKLSKNDIEVITNKLHNWLGAYTVEVKNLYEKYAKEPWRQTKAKETAEEIKMRLKTIPACADILVQEITEDTLHTSALCSKLYSNAQALEEKNVETDLKLNLASVFPLEIDTFVRSILSENEVDVLPTFIPNLADFSKKLGEILSKDSSDVQGKLKSYTGNMRAKTDLEALRTAWSNLLLKKSLADQEVLGAILTKTFEGLPGVVTHFDTIKTHFDNAINWASSDNGKIAEFFNSYREKKCMLPTLSFGLGDFADKLNLKTYEISATNFADIYGEWGTLATAWKNTAGLNDDTLIVIDLLSNNLKDIFIDSIDGYSMAADIFKNRWEPTIQKLKKAPNNKQETVKWSEVSNVLAGLLVGVGAADIKVDLEGFFNNTLEPTNNLDLLLQLSIYWGTTLPTKDAFIKALSESKKGSRARPALGANTFGVYVEYSGDDGWYFKAPLTFTVKPDWNTKDSKIPIVSVVAVDCSSAKITNNGKGHAISFDESSVKISNRTDKDFISAEQTISFVFAFRGNTVSSNSEQSGNFSFGIGAGDKVSATAGYNTGTEATGTDIYHYPQAYLEISLKLQIKYDVVNGKAFDFGYESTFVVEPKDVLNSSKLSIFVNPSFKNTVRLKEDN